VRVTAFYTPANVKLRQLVQKLFLDFVQRFNKLPLKNQITCKNAGEKGTKNIVRSELEKKKGLI